MTITQHPRYVDLDKCIGCGLCAEKCPKKVDDQYNEGLIKRKAIYVPYSQAVPLKYTIDPKQCIYLTKGKCGACEKNCPSGAINFKDQAKDIVLKAGSIVLAPGFTSFDPSEFDSYSYTNFPDVVTALEFERILSATGPYSGHLYKPSSKKGKKSQGQEPQKIAWLQCIGSRDLNRCDNAYCSSVCCMYAVKQSIMAKEHATDDLDCAIFYMDMRTQGKDFDRYLEKAKGSGVRFIPARVHSIEKPENGPGMRLRYVDLHGNIINETFDLVVLSTGLQISPSTRAMASNLGVELDRHAFTQTNCFHPVATSVPGIYACGVMTGPKDIPQSVMEASAAAWAATQKISGARNTATKHVETPAPRDIRREKPRIGVFVCNCGINIGGIVRVPEVAEYARTLPNVIYVEENLFTCSQDTQDKLTEVIEKQGLNRVVIAACTPRTHEPLFQETLINAGLNKFMIEMANIRNHDSWVHANDPDAATAKAKDLVRMAVAKVTLATPLEESQLPVEQSGLVVGGGLSGMVCALGLARQGYPVHLVEKSDSLGGNARFLRSTYTGDNIQDQLQKIIAQVKQEELITLHLETEIDKVDGFVGNFQTRLKNRSGQQIEVKHGVTILATGANEYKPKKEYLYGQHPAVLTHLELDAKLEQDQQSLSQAQNVVFIQCVGSRNQEHPYCSKVCCTHSIKSALALKELNPDLNIYILYRDIRTYGQRETLYQKARSKGILFFRYDPDDKPQIQGQGKQVQVTFKDQLIGRTLSVDADLLCLATAIVSNQDQDLARQFKISLDADGWMMEAHQKLRPVDFPTDGIFLCGLSHYPKPVEESIAQAQAAASRAITVLSKDKIQVGGIVSRVQPQLCSGCRGCINVCPFQAISFNEQDKVAEVNYALCKGCGACAATCPSEAVVLMGFNNEQLYAQIQSALCA